MVNGFLAMNPPKILGLAFQQMWEAGLEDSGDVAIEVGQV